MIGIYKITSPSGKVYIGQSVNIERRFKHYKGVYCKAQPIIYRSLKKHGAEKHKFEILCECEIHELNDKERYYQDLYSATSKNGMNCRLTFSSDRSGKITIQKSKETLLKMSLAQKNKNPEVYLRQGITLSKNELNTKRLKENNEKRKIKIGVFDFNTDEKISEFSSMRECAKIMKIDRKSISMSCKNIHPFAYGYKFELI